MARWSAAATVVSGMAKRFWVAGSYTRLYGCPQLTDWFFTTNFSDESVNERCCITSGLSIPRPNVDSVSAGAKDRFSSRIQSSASWLVVPASPAKPSLVAESPRFVDQSFGVPSYSTTMLACVQVLGAPGMTILNAAIFQPEQPAAGTGAGAPEITPGKV